MIRGKRRSREQGFELKMSRNCRHDNRGRKKGGGAAQ
jgi:hypothetical protein